jgi:hypothetical protein
MDLLFVAVVCMLGMLAVVMAIDVVRLVRRRREASPPPVTRGQLHLFDDDGDHFLSCKLPVAGLRKILDDFNRGRLR